MINYDVQRKKKTPLSIANPVSSVFCCEVERFTHRLVLNNEWVKTSIWKHQSNKIDQIINVNPGLINPLGCLIAGIPLKYPIFTIWGVPTLINEHNFLIQGWHYIYLIVILVVSSSSILISYNNLIDTYKILIYYYWILLSIRKPPNKKV